MRISDWSSDVCSADRRAAQTAAAGDLDAFRAETQGRLHRALHGAAECHTALQLVGDALRDELGVDFRLAAFDDVQADVRRGQAAQLLAQRSEERRVGKACVSTCRLRWSQLP